MTALRVGDTARTTLSWGPKSTSRRDICPRCRRFIAHGQKKCGCGVKLDYLTDGVAEVISLGA